MNRTRLLWVTNALLTASALVQIVTGLVEVSEELHEVNGFVMSGLILVHVLLHWKWFRSNLWLGARA